MEKKKKLFWLVLCTVVLFVMGKSFYDTNFFKVVETKITSDKLPPESRLKILQISDLHAKNFGVNNQRLKTKIAQLNPDFIVITGDLVDRSTEDFTEVLLFIEELVELNEHVYFVSGNHEWGNPSHEMLFQELASLGVVMLDNTHRVISNGEATINLMGVADVSTNHDDLDAAWQGVNQELYTILLSHTPIRVAKTIDLTLSGHTHGGQIRFRGIGGVIAPDQGFFPTYDKGLYTLEQGNYLYIDSGLGTSVLPIRFFNQSQISLIIIKGE